MPSYDAPAVLDRDAANPYRFGEIIRTLLDERGWTQRMLAEAASVDPAHISRIVRSRGKRRPSPDLVARVADALCLPREYFPEYREWLVVTAVQSDPALRDRLYSRVVRSVGAR
jgi:transcriptional regulator with XRE-family HTH domain